MKFISRMSSGLFGIVFLVIMVHPFLESFLFNGFGLVDEIAIALLLVLGGCYCLFVFKADISLLAVAVWAILLVSVSILIGESSSQINVIKQAFGQSKFFLFVIFACSVLNFSSSLKYLHIVVWVSLFGAILNILFPDTFFDLGLRERYRFDFYDIPRIGGFQMNPNRLGRILAFIPLLTPSMLRIKKLHFYLLVVFSFLVLLLTFSRTSLLIFTLCSFFHVYIILSANGKRLFISVFCVFSCFLALVLFPLLVSGSLFFDISFITDSFRFLLLTESVDLAVERFPFGTGLSTFASPYSLDADVYERTAIYGTHFYNQDLGLNDINYAAVLGETGFLGIILLAFLFYVVILKGRSYLPVSYKIVFSLIFFILMGVESVLQSSITSATYALFFCLVIHFYKEKVE